MSLDTSRPFWGYPQALKGPDRPYKPEHQNNPAIRGWLLVLAVYVMELLRPVREVVWANAGFSSLRRLRAELEDYEPLHDPTVVPIDPVAPLHHPDSHDDDDDDAANNETNDNDDGGEDDDISHTNGNSNGGTAATATTAKVTLSAPASSSPSSPPRPLSKTYYSASTYRKLYLAGDLTPTDVARAILPLIRRDTEPKGPHHLYFFDSRADLVLQAAEASTRRYREGRSLGPLDGVPCAVKDEYDLDGYRTCLGSANDYTPEPPKSPSGGDDGSSGGGDGSSSSSSSSSSITSWCARKLQEAGVIIVGKTSMHEFGMDTTGNQPMYGTPRNPFHEGYYTGGSSSGTGGAVGLGLVPIGLGSDGGGSIRIPSGYCGIFGLKPAHGRLSFWPGTNHSNTCAVLGPMACDVASLAAVFEVVARPHPTSPFALPGVPRWAPLSAADRPAGAPRRVLGVCRAWFDDCAPAVRELCWGLVDRLAAGGGYEVVDVEIPFLKEGQTAHAMTVLTDASTLLPKYDNLTWGNRILLALGRTTPATDYLLAQKLRRCLMMHLAHLWSRHPGMLLVTPTTACAGWRIHDTRGELRYGLTDGDKTIESMRYVWLANFCGLPSISVPAGYVSPEGKDNGGGKVPVGLMATAEWADEQSLLEFAVEAEGVGADARERPPGWVDVVELAREKRAEGDGRG